MKLSQEHFTLWEVINKILWKDWDPIGVSDYDGWPDDEYNGYVPQIFQLKIQGASREVIANELYKYEIENMGLPGDKNYCLEIAQKIIDL